MDDTASRDVEQRLAQLVQHLPMAVLLETPDRKVSQTNRAFCEMFAVPVPPQDLVGADCVESARALAPILGGIEEFLARAQHLIDVGERVVGERIELTDGRVLERDFLVLPMDGKRREVVWIYRDVTAADAARRSAELLARQRRELLTTISHDVRTPLVGVVGMVDLLLQQALDAGTRELVENVQQSAMAMATMLDNVLDLARADAGRLELSVEETSICDLVESVAGMVGPTAQAKSLPLIAAAGPSLQETVRTDPGRLRQVVLNLLSNAVKFTDDGAVVLVADSDGGDLALTVSDSGPGMAPAQLERVFDQFVQGGGDVNRRFGGSGLGLAIAHRLTAALGGTIEVRSAVGEGSTFTVRLPGAAAAQPFAPTPTGLRAWVRGHPLARPAVVSALQRSGIDSADGPDGADVEVLIAGSVAQAQQAVPTATGRRLIILVPASAAACPPLAGTPVSLPWTRERLAAALTQEWSTPALHARAALPPGTRVLLAEDEPANRNVLAEMLRRLGARPTAVGNGLEALQALAADRFDVVLLDLAMPVMDGWAAVREMHQRLPAERCPPILALTADTATDPTVLTASGFAGSIRKPAGTADLSAGIMSVLPGDEHAPPVRAGDAPVDPAVLQVLARDLDDGDVVRQSLDIYLEELPGRLEALSAGLAVGGFDVLRDTAHALKSASQMLGAAALADLCRDLEAAAGAETRDAGATGGDLQPMVDALHAEALRVAQWLADFRDAGYPGLPATAGSARTSGA